MLPRHINIEYRHVLLELVYTEVCRILKTARRLERIYQETAYTDKEYLLLQTMLVFCYSRLQYLWNDPFLKTFAKNRVWNIGQEITQFECNKNLLTCNYASLLPVLLEPVFEEFNRRHKTHNICHTIKEELMQKVWNPQRLFSQDDNQFQKRLETLLSAEEAY